MEIDEGQKALEWKVQQRQQSEGEELGIRDNKEADQWQKVTKEERIKILREAESQNTDIIFSYALFISSKAILLMPQRNKRKGRVPAYLPISHADTGLKVKRKR